MKSRIKKFILQALLRMDGTPMTDGALRAAIGEVFQCLVSDIDVAIKETEADNFICGNRDTLTERVTWTLTEKGTHKAKQLG